MLSVQDTIDAGILGFLCTGFYEKSANFRSQVSTTYPLAF